MAITLLSQSNQYYKAPKSVQVAGENFADISSMDTKTYIDIDNKQRTISNLEGKDARYAIYQEGDKLLRTETKYSSPISVVIDGKKHDNIIRKISVPNKHTVYERMKNNDILSQSFIEIKSNGEVINHLSTKQKLVQKPLKLATKIVKSLKCLF